MANRLNLHEELCALLGSRNVYFQPPESTKLVYPCIIYRLNSIRSMYANNKHYIGHDQYIVTVIDRDPDSDIEYRFLSYFPMAHFDRSYSTGGLNHSIFTLYY